MISPPSGAGVSQAGVERPEPCLMCSKSSINVNVSFSVASSFYRDFIFILMSASGVSRHQVLLRCLVNKQWSPGLQEDPAPLYRL